MALRKRIVSRPGARRPPTEPLVPLTTTCRRYRVAGACLVFVLLMLPGASASDPGPAPESAALTAIVIGGVAIVIYGPQTEGRLDGVGIDAFRPRPVEVGHRLEATEAGTGEAALEPAITPATASGTCLWLAREVGALAH